MKFNFEKYDGEVLIDNTFKVIVKFESEEIARKIAKKYSEFRDSIKIKIDKNLLEIIYFPDSWCSTEEIDNEIDIMFSWIEKGEI